jgi:hypothetical protein
MLARTLLGQISVGRPGLKCDNNIKMDHKEKWWKVVIDSCSSGWKPVVKSCKHVNELPGFLQARKFFE